MPSTSDIAQANGRVATDRLVRDLVARLDDKPTARSKLKVVLAACGWKRRSAQNVAAVQAALEDAGIYPRPRLTEPGLKPDTFITFSRVAYPSIDTGLTFPSEAALRDFLVVNHRHVPPLDRLKRPQPEYVLPSGLKIDVLFRERGTNAYVVVELKLAGGGYGVGSQLVTYMQELRNAVGPDPTIRGLLVTGTTNTLLEDDVVELARTFGFKVDWLCYAASLELQPVLSSHPGLEVTA